EQARERELREKALHRQAQLKAELARVETPAAYRKRLQEALQAARELERTAALAAERQTAAAARAAEAEEQRRLLQELAEQERDGERRTLEWAERLMALHNDAAAGERRMALLEQAAAREGERVRARLKAAEAEAMAAALAAHLHDGGACPVCGSTEHPNPASHRPEGGDGTAAATDGGEVSPEALEACRQELREGRFHARRLLDKLESLEKQWAQQAVADGVPAAETPASILKLREAGQARLEAAAAVAEEAEVRTTAAFEQALAAHSDVTQGLEREIEALERSWQALLQDRRQSAKRRQELEARLQSVQSLVDAESRKAQEWTDTRSRLRDQWQASYAEWEPEQLPELAGQLERSDAAAEEIRQRLAKSVTFLEEQQVRLEQLHKELADAEKLAVRTAAEQEALQRQIGQRQERLFALVGDGDANKLTLEANGALSKLRADAATAASLRDQAQAAHQSAASQAAAAVQAEQSAAALERETQNEWEQQSLAAGFASAAEVEDALIAEAQRGEWAAEVEAHGKQEHQLAVRRQELEQALAGRHVSDEAWDALEQELALCKAEDEAALQTSAKAERDCEDVRAKHGRWLELEQKRAALQAELTLLGKLQSVLRGNAFVEFLAEEQLMHVSRAASERLGQLTRRKYAIEVDSGGGFVIRDDANGGTRRPVTTLSGGETFLTSLSLALALSTQIQLKGEYPLEFFFLDEGFGTLDPELLDAVVTALEKLHLDNLTVGVISHVPELRARLPRRLVVQPAEPGGRGSRVTLETM
ncbi:SbcC/MukB-like Walker B domain-containing protein, partial [Paenibacillus validus]